MQFTEQMATHQLSYIYHSLQHAACTTATKRREQNRIYLYAAVNLKRNLRSTYRYCDIKASYEASRGLSATARLLVWPKALTA